MMKNLVRGLSLKSFDNEEVSSFENNIHKKLPHHFTVVNDRNEHYSQKSLDCFYTSKCDRSRDKQQSLNRINSSNFLLGLNRSDARKPLNEILRSNNSNSFHGLIKSQRDKILYKPQKTQIKQSKTKRISQLPIQKPNFSNSKETHQQSFNCFQAYRKAVDQNFTLIKLRENVKQIKIQHSQTQHSRSRSCSSTKKGLQCTLYERSLQKKINQSTIKSNKKLVTVKKKFEKTEYQWGIDSEVPQKDVRKILLKRKGKNIGNLNNTNCFDPITLGGSKSKSKKKEVDKSAKRDNNFHQRQKSKVNQIQHSVSRNKKKQLFIQLNKSMTFIKQTCRDHNFISSKQKQQKLRKFQQSNVRRSLSKSNNGSLNLSLKSKKLIINQRTKQNLNKIHEKYKFILNYLSDFDIIGKLNGYQIGGKEQCKWILLIIDEVYEMIKHSDQTKLKGIDYTRDYQYNSLKKEQNSS